MTLRHALLALALACGLGWAPPLRAEPAAGTVWTEPTTGIAFVWVPGGSVEMGCRTQPCPESELPAHRRRVEGFWLSRTEVTQGQWRRLMELNPSKFQKGDDYPVDQVTWEDAHAFLDKMTKTGHGSFRLPTEAEWEHACRAGGDDPYCGGDSPEAVAWFIANSRMSTQPVGQKAPNRLGLADMSGNLYEWVEDCWTESHAGAPADGRARKDGGCQSRVLRGGSWGNYPSLIHASTRRSDTDVKCPFIGLRVARAP